MTLADIFDHLCDNPRMKGHRVGLTVTADSGVGGELDENPVKASVVGRWILHDEGSDVAYFHDR
jgi:hypothetical protein